VPAVLARQAKLSDLPRTLQSWPDRADCSGADVRLVQLITEGCEGLIAADRCMKELPLGALLLVSDEPYLTESLGKNVLPRQDSRYPDRAVSKRTARADALRSLIKLV
jgi:hypothetical protein